jgi:hypothetical protein
VKGYERNCLHHDLKVPNNLVPPPSNVGGFGWGMTDGLNRTLKIGTGLV